MKTMCTPRRPSALPSVLILAIAWGAFGCQSSNPLADEVDAGNSGGAGGAVGAGDAAVGGAGGPEVSVGGASPNADGAPASGGNVAP